jgi:hypothetical protein
VLTAPPLAFVLVVLAASAPESEIGSVYSAQVGARDPGTANRREYLHGPTGFSLQRVRPEANRREGRLTVREVCEDTCIDQPTRTRVVVEAVHCSIARYGCSWSAPGALLVKSEAAGSSPLDPAII